MSAASGKDGAGVFFGMCRSISSLSLSQGFGGNASAKLDGRRMLVKASGMRLSAVGPGKGYSVLEYPPIARLYSGRREADEKASTTRIAISVLAGGEKKPSMEAGFHSFLGTYVAHVHPVCFNAIASQKDAKRIFSSIFGKGGFIWVEYARPGHSLARAVRRATGGKKRCIIFLQNHGAIVSSENAEQCARQVKSIEAESFSYLGRRLPGLQAFKPSKLRRIRGGWLNPSKGAREFASDSKNAKYFLFPDAAVFFAGAWSAQSKIKAAEGKGVEYHLPNYLAEAANETLEAHLYVLEAARLLGKPLYLERAEIASLRAMESEKHRMKRAGI